MVYLMYFGKARHAVITEPRSDSQRNMLEAASAHCHRQVNSCSRRAMRCDRFRFRPVMV